MSAPTHDAVSVVFRALPFGVAVGVGCQALVTWAVRALQAAQPPGATAALDTPAALVLLLGTLAGIVIAGASAWRMLRPIGNPWRQAMLAIIAALGSFAFSLVTLPLDRAFGRPGLLALALASAFVATLLRRGASGPGSR